MITEIGEKVLKVGEIMQNNCMGEVLLFMWIEVANRNLEDIL